MSIESMSEIWGISFLNPTQKLVALALADEGIATTNELAAKLGMESSVVYEILKSIPMTIMYMEGNFTESDYDTKFWLSWENKKIEGRNDKQSNK
jgi:hypothetical protein